MDIASIPVPTTAAGPGITLAREYYEMVVAPLLDRWCPGLSYAAARIGTGSEVLGLDDDMSTDHDWGLRLQLFVDDLAITPVTAVLDRHLPTTFRGFPVRLTFAGQVEPRLGIDITTIGAFARAGLGFDATGAPSMQDWLSLSGQAVLEVIAGAVFRDPDGRLLQLQKDLTWYPDDLWYYLIACDWQRLDQELPLMARAGYRGDDLGSAVIAARLTDIAMHLAFLLSRRWPPYSKWRGTVFARLPIAGLVREPLEAVMRAHTWPARNGGLQQALTGLAAVQQDLGLPSSSRPIRPFWDRPFLRVDPDLVPALFAAIGNDEIRALGVGLGSIEQLTDNVDVLGDARRRRRAVGG